MGVNTQILWLVILIESLFMESLTKSWLRPYGVFFMFSMFSFMALFFEYRMVAETVGLSEREKKELYIPGSQYGRKLRMYERHQIPPSPALSVFSDLSGSVNLSR